MAKVATKAKWWKKSAKSGAKTATTAAKKGGRKKKIAKKIGMAALSTGVGLGAEYALSKMMGGPDLTPEEIRQATFDAGVGMASRGLQGERGNKMIRQEVGRAFGNQYDLAAARRGRKPGYLPKRDALAVLQEMQKINKYVRGRGKNRKQQLYRGLTHNRFGPRPFGTGAGKRSKKKKKKGKKKKKKKGKRKAGRLGLKAMDVAAARSRHKKMRDIFSVM